MVELAPWYEARERMVEAVRADLFGSSADEVLDEEPLERFIVGILHPQSAGGGQETVEAANEIPDDEAGAAPDAEFDPGVSYAHLRYPSTIGMTVGLTASTTALAVEVAADRYEPTGSSKDGSDDGSLGSRARGTRADRWRRVGVGPLPIELPVVPGTKITHTVTPGLDLRVIVRDARDGIVNVTLVLVNTQTRPEKGKADHLCWFRPSMVVRTVHGEFADRRPPHVLEHLDSDERGGELLYRRQRLLAIGHGIAVSWSEAEHVYKVESTFFPAHDLRLAKADRDDLSGLEMRALAEAGGVEELQAPLTRLVDAYEAWVADQRAKADAEDLPQHQASTVRDHLTAAQDAARRIRNGIRLLEEDAEARRSFQVMNAVMQVQRERQEYLRTGKAGAVGVWRPFQMAFILLNLEGLARPQSKDRDLADLLWFPTGGGKTEAYLGLIAFALVHRRLRRAGADRDGAGVGVIMRYTLRLLTLQQFERAAGLVCALEMYRESDPELAEQSPFAIGLWVGQGATPNSVDNAKSALKKLSADEDPGELGNPVQLLRCPWCGTDLGPQDYQAPSPSGHMTVTCPSIDCRFHRGNGLPVYLVDEDVYSKRPSLIIGTVDKFAMLAWNERSGRLFGSGHDAPPDLIVQDELHLISGPLGTLVGLYETAIDHLATDPDTKARPKLVASTATIRRASEQVAAVFNRESRQFPPPGLDAEDSFFAVDANPDEKGTRRYVGLMAPSTSHSTLLVRTYAALLQGAADLDATPEVKDAYWTILGYFNSLRVLGAAYIQSVDDVPDRIKVVARRHGTEMRMTRDPRELTSRKKSSEIPNELAYLQTPYPVPTAPDVVLATNMISVGVDVDRLGLMAIMGQPQTTSEYIQASSRVGRKYPGLVFTLYNASRSRDLSHYESFTSYHRALYKQVEATGATPFAPRALDRGLHGVLTILARHTTPGAAADKSVGIPVDSDTLDGVSEVIIKRAMAVGDEEAAASVAASLRELTTMWADAWRDREILQYPRWPFQSTDVKSLLTVAGATTKNDKTGETLAETFPPGEVPWPTLTSLRNVDSESTLKVISIKKNKAVADDGND